MIAIPLPFVIGLLLVILLIRIFCYAATDDAHVVVGGQCDRVLLGDHFAVSTGSIQRTAVPSFIGCTLT